MAESGAMRDKSISQNDKSSQTHERLAAEYNVSPATCTQTKPATYAASGITGRSSKGNGQI